MRPEQGGVRRDRLRFGLVFLSLLLVIAIPASAVNSLAVTTVSPVNGQTVSGSITWKVVIGSANVGRVDFAIDGTVKWSEHVAPWLYNGVTSGLKTTALSNGAHTLTAKAYSKNGRSTGTSTVTITVSNPAPAPPPPLSPTLMPPTSSTPPAISGTPTVGQTLSASTGSWSGSTPMSYAYSWSRCNSTGGSCSPISGATSAGYLLGSGDAGSTIRVSVTATNGAGSATATSAATGVVGVAAPATGLGTALPPRMPESSGTSSIYVATNGSDSNSGTLASPVQTLSKAFSLAANGSVIYARGGNYGVQSVLHDRFSPTNPVTLTSYPGERAVFVGQTAYTNAVLFEDDQGIRIRAVTFAAPTNTNIKIDTSQHMELDRVISRDADRNGSGFPSNAGQGLLVEGQAATGHTLTYSEDIQVWNSTFTNNGGQSTGFSGSEAHDHAIYMGGGAAPASTEGGVLHFTIANSVFFDSPCGEVIQLGGEADSGYVVNNSFFNATASAGPGGDQITVWDDASTTWGTRNVLIANNIFSTETYNAVRYSGGQNPPGNMVRNNLAFAFGTSPAYNPAYGSSTGFSVGTNITPADPLYVDAVGSYGDIAGKDFHLQAGSPALGKSDPAYTPPFDKDGNPRPAAPALGAFG
jgi:hypothetical protein